MKRFVEIAKKYWKLYVFGVFGMDPVSFGRHGRIIGCGVYTTCHRERGRGAPYQARTQFHSEHGHQVVLLDLATF